jgi:hypothetical protein
MASDGKDRSATRASSGRLRDELIDLYLDWREEAAAVADMYALWADATADDKSARFAAVTAAIDREEAAARSYADLLADGERSSHG